MLTTVVQKLENKSFDKPEEKRRPPKTEVDIVSVSDNTLGRFTFEPGWSWSESIKPVVHTDSCQNNHLGYCVAGTLIVDMEDGSSATIRAGEAYSIPPGHQARVEGNEAFVGLEFMSAASYAKPS
jgi:quercetin dioxygenase-like cupin family protein